MYPRQTKSNVLLGASSLASENRPPVRHAQFGLPRTPFQLSQSRGIRHGALSVIHTPDTAEWLWLYPALVKFCMAFRHASWGPGMLSAR